MTDSGSTRVYFRDINSLTDEERFNSMLDSVSETRRNKVMSYRFMKDRCLSLGAELLLRDALAERGIDRSGLLEFEYRKNGKPYLKNHADIFFNLSHSGDYVMCAISDSEVGCDIQKTDKADIKLAERFFTDREYHVIADLPAEKDREDMFYRYWTLKESFMKATGLGMQLPLDAFEILIGNPDSMLKPAADTSDTCITLTQSVDDHTYSFTEYDSIPGYKAAICRTTGGN